MVINYFKHQQQDLDLAEEDKFRSIIPINSPSLSLSIFLSDTHTLFPSNTLFLYLFPPLFREYNGLIQKRGLAVKFRV